MTIFFSTVIEYTCNPVINTKELNKVAFKIHVRLMSHLLDTIFTKVLVSD